MLEVVLVTGASSGVGEALAPMLAERGYKVYGMSRREVHLPGVTALPADVSDAEAVEGAVQRLIEESGRLDIVMHCAGIGGAGPVEQMPTDRAHRIMETNFAINDFLISDNFLTNISVEGKEDFFPSKSCGLIINFVSYFG